MMKKSKSNNIKPKSSSGKKVVQFNSTAKVSHWKPNANSHMHRVMSTYGDDYGKKNVQVSVFLKKNGYPSVAKFLENGK